MVSHLPPSRYDLSQNERRELPVPLRLFTVAILSVASWALLVWAASCCVEVVS
jgi:hypothetical protein